MTIPRRLRQNIFPILFLYYADGKYLTQISPAFNTEAHNIFAQAESTVSIISANTFGFTIFKFDAWKLEEKMIFFTYGVHRYYLPLNYTYKQTREKPEAALQTPY